METSQSRRRNASTMAYTIGMKSIAYAIVLYAISKVSYGKWWEYSDDFQNI